MTYKAKKYFGQNFLTNVESILALVDTAELSKDDAVLEIGPGRGAVTEFLLQDAKNVVAVEIDSDLITYLRERFGKYENFTLVEGTILDFDPNLYFPETSYKIIGSLPYNISKQIIKKFLEIKIAPKSMSVIVQKEVAESYAAQPPKATFLSNYSKIFSTVLQGKTISASFFEPKPKVDGSILSFTSISPKVDAWRELVKLFKMLFLNPRKTLLNNISGSIKLERKRILDIFNALNLSETVRASELSFEQWLLLYKEISSDLVGSTKFVH